MKKTIAILMAAALAWTSVSGQGKVWTLDSCFAWADTHNTSILMAATDIRKSRLQLLQSKAELLPTLQLYVNQYYNWGRSVDMQELVIVKNRLTRQTSASVGASFSIFDGFARLNTIAANRAMAASAASSAAQTALEVKADIARAYLGNILARLTVERLVQSHDAICRQLSQARALAECGQRNSSDILALEAKAADILSQIAETESEGEAQMLQLHALTGCAGPFETDIAMATGSWPDTYCDLMQFPDDETGYQPVTPAVEAARQSAESARYALKAARGALFPTLSLSAGYGTYYSDAGGATFKEQIDGNRNPSISLSLAVPVFDCARGITAVARAREDLAAQQLKLRQAEEQARQQWQQMHLQYHTLARQEKSLQVKAAFCEEKLRRAGQEYELGTISAQQWVEACEDYSQSGCELLQCRCKYIFQRIIMKLYYDGIQK